MIEIPEIRLPVAPRDAYLCVVNGTSQGVVTHRDVKRIWQSAAERISVQRENGLYVYDADAVWGAWMKWPVKFLRSSAGKAPMGPRYLFDVKWTEWEWDDGRGGVMHRYTPVPVKHSIWCDGTVTDGDPLTASVELGGDKWFTIGWARADRVIEHNRIDSFHYPYMP